MTTAAASSPRRRVRFTHSLRRLAPLLLVAAVGCTSATPNSAQSPSPDPSEATGASGTLITGPSATPASPGVTPGGGKGTTVGSTRQPAPGASASRGKDWAPLEVSVNRTCLRRGDELIANAKSLPYADFAFTTGYSKAPNEPKIIPDYAYLDGAANPSGEVTWSVVIRPTVPYGPAVFKVVVKTPDGKGAFESIDLVIAKECP